MYWSHYEIILIEAGVTVIFLCTKIHQDAYYQMYRVFPMTSFIGTDGRRNIFVLDWPTRTAL